MAKIVTSDEVPEQDKQRLRVAHQIAEQAHRQVWTISVDACHKISAQLTGNQALSYFSTIISDFIARWILTMEPIAQDDIDAGVTKEDIFQTIFDGVSYMLDTKKLERVKTPLPNGIKGLKG